MVHGIEPEHHAQLARWDTFDDPVLTDDAAKRRLGRIGEIRLPVERADGASASRIVRQLGHHEIAEERPEAFLAGAAETLRSSRRSLGIAFKDRLCYRPARTVRCSRRFGHGSRRGHTMNFMRIWSDLSMWNKFGLAVVGAAIIIAVVLWLV